MVLGVVSFCGLIAGFFGFQFEMALYGLETNEPLSLIGLLICSEFIFKGIVSYGLWTEKSWAVNLAIIDAYISLAACVFSMIGLPFIGYGLSIRLELALVIPYLLKLQKIQPQWNRTLVLSNAL
jgi:uncharacterized membrane protein (DUF2068 family)